jgi:hypothetical protein
MSMSQYDNRIPEQRLDRNGKLVTRHINPNKKPRHSTNERLARGLYSVGHLIEKTSAKPGSGHIESSVYDDPFQMLLDNPTSTVMLPESAAGGTSMSGSSIFIGFYQGRPTAYVTTTEKYEDVAATYAERRGLDVAAVSKGIRRNLDAVNGILEKDGMYWSVKDLENGSEFIKTRAGDHAL